MALDLDFAPLTIGDTEYKLAFDFNSVSLAEEALTKAGVLQPNESLLFVAWPANTRSVPVLLAAALQHYQPQIKEEDARKLVNGKNVYDVLIAVYKARDLFFPEPEPKKGDGDVADAAGDVAGGIPGEGQPGS